MTKIQQYMIDQICDEMVHTNKEITPYNVGLQMGATDEVSLYTILGYINRFKEKQKLVDDKAELLAELVKKDTEVIKLKSEVRYLEMVEAELREQIEQLKLSYARLKEATNNNTSIDTADSLIDSNKH